MALALTANYGEAADGNPGLDAEPNEGRVDRLGGQAKEVRWLSSSQRSAQSDDHGQEWQENVNPNQTTWSLLLAIDHTAW